VNLLDIGIIVFFIGAVWFLAEAYHRSIFWLLGCLLIPFLWIIFFVKYWWKMRRPFVVSMFGVVIILGTFLILPGSYGNSKIVSRFRRELAAFMNMRPMARSIGTITTNWPGGRPAPSFSLKDLTGNMVSLSDFKGKVVILDFWATWCPPCALEIPHFVTLQEQYWAMGFTVLGVAVSSGDAGMVNSFARKYRINYPILMADGQVQKAFGGIRSIPTTFIIDAEGNMRYRYIGYRDKAVFEAAILPLLKVAKSNTASTRTEISHRRKSTKAKSATEPNTPGRKLIGYRVDTSRKDENGRFIRIPVYEDDSN